MKKRKDGKNRSSNWRKAGEAGLTVGKWLVEFLDGMLEAITGPLEGKHAYMRRVSGWPDELPRHRIYGEMRRMRNRGWIKVAEKQGNKFVKLTEKGRLELLYRKLQAFKDSKNKKWDGGWWMALYDIPEHGRNERYAIRDALRLAGFYQLQKSVYVHPYKIPSELAAYLKDAKLLEFIRFVHVDHMDGAREIEKYFSLRRR